MGYRDLRSLSDHAWGYTKPDSTTYSPDGTTANQDFSYTYDGVGNVTQIESSGNNVGIGGTNSLTRTFEYDPLYRLTEATGREYAANPSNPWDYMPAGGNANDPNQTRAYTESYDYDTVGNMKTLTHDYGAGTGTWTRDYVTESTTNRLDQMTSAGGTHQYTYDEAGNLTSENTDRKYEWDARGRMRSFRNQVSGSQATVFAHYTYDGGGQRVQKVVSKDSGKPVHSVYIGGIFEHHERIDGGSVDAEVNHLHVMDDQKRVAIQRVGSELDGSNPPTTQYHLGDHLQSSNVVLDGTGTLFNREEYRPFGESSFGSYATKRYRFTGQERDEESSLSYHGARYYAPWTAQWTSPDPKGMVDGTNLYGYSRNNPVNRTDPGGMQSGDPPPPVPPTPIETPELKGSPTTLMSISSGSQLPFDAQDAPSQISVSKKTMENLKYLRDFYDKPGTRNDLESAGVMGKPTKEKTYIQRLHPDRLRKHADDPSGEAPTYEQSLMEAKKGKFPEGGGTIHFHTHPPGGSFSIADIHAAARSDAKGSFVIGTKGRTTLLVPTQRTRSTLETYQGYARKMIGELGAGTFYVDDETEAEVSSNVRALMNQVWTEYYSDLEGKSVSDEVRSQYAQLSVAHEFGFAVYRWSESKGKLIKLDLSSKSSRLEAAKNLTPQSNSKEQGERNENRPE